MFMDRWGNPPNLGSALLLGVIILMVVGMYYFYEANWTGANVAAWERGGCPEGYVSAPTTGYTTSGNGGVLALTTCVPDLRPR